MDRDRELQLVDGLRAGDPTAFDAVYESFNSRLYNFLARLTNRRDVAEAQDMRMPGTQDPLDVALGRLTPLTPNALRAEAVRRRCRARLARRTVGSRRPGVARGSWMAVAVTVLLGLFSAFYAAALLSTVLHIERWLP